MIAAFTLFTSVAAWVVAHQTFLLMVVSCLFTFEQWLGSTDKLKSNSTLQLVGNFISGLLKVTGLVYKLSTGKVMLMPVEPPAPAAPTPAEVMQKAIESPASVLQNGEAAVFQQAFEAGNESNAQALNP